MSDARAATDGGLPDQIEQIVGVLAVTSMNLSLEDWNTISNVLLDGAARIRELEARQVPDGWQVVPKEPTEEMVEDAAKAIHDTDDMADTSWPVKDDDTGYRGGGGWVRLCRDPEMFREAARAAHSAMLAAAPRP